MEFTIDLATVMKMIRAEITVARSQLESSGPLKAYQLALTRHDASLEQASDSPTLACKAGCAWCCHFSVDIRPVEALNILEHVQNQFTPNQITALRREMASNSEILAPLDDIQRMQTTLKCPFLMEQQCSIYTARPQTCRNYHATDAAGCKQSFDEPNNLDIAPEFAPMVYQSGAAHLEAFAKTIQDSGYDHAAYELNSAMTELLANPEATRQRFDAKLPTFVGFQGTDVALEFIEEDE